jgi:hypothetical protein
MFLIAIAEGRTDIMANSPHPGGPKTLVERDEPNRRDGTRRGNRGADRQADKVGEGTFADQPPDQDDLTRGAPPKPHKRYSHAG